MEDLQVITHKERDGKIVIALDGVVDAASAGKLEQTLNHLVSHNVYNLTVDLSRVEYLNARGAGLLIGLSELAKQNKGQLVLLNPQPAVRDVFELLGFNHLVKITNDRQNLFNTAN